MPASKMSTGPLLFVWNPYKHLIIRGKQFLLLQCKKYQRTQQLVPDYTYMDLLQLQSDLPMFSRWRAAECATNLKPAKYWYNTFHIES